MIETRTAATFPTVARQYVWGVTYTDELVQIGINDVWTDDDEGEGEEEVAYVECDSFYWTCQDANYNVTQLFDADGDVVERYVYTPYGQRTVFIPVDGSDTFCTHPIGRASQLIHESEVEEDYLSYGLCDIGHQGLMYDKEIDLHYNRARYLESTLGRFTGRDPKEYIDGNNLYEYLRGNPLNGLDPMGMAKGTVVAKKAITVWSKGAIRRLVRHKLLQSHHLLQQVLFKGGKLGRWLATKVAKDGADNLIYLPTLKSGGKKLAQRAAAAIAAGKSVGPTRQALAAFAKASGHQGRHLGRYLKHQKKVLMDIMKRNLAGELTDAQAKAQVKALQAQLRKGLEKGIIRLQAVELLSLSHGLPVYIAGFGVLSPLSEDEIADREEKFDAWVNQTIQGNRRVAAGMRFADIFKEGWLREAAELADWLNPVDLYATAEEAAIAKELFSGKHDAVIRAKMVELGLLPDPDLEAIVILEMTKAKTLAAALQGKKYEQTEEEQANMRRFYTVKKDGVYVTRLGAKYHTQLRTKEGKAAAASRLAEATNRLLEEQGVAKEKLRIIDVK